MAAGLSKEQVESVDAPRLADSLGALECQVMRVVQRPDSPRLHHLDVRLRETARTFEGVQRLGGLPTSLPDRAVPQP